ncbi:MAG TPA: LysR family transcriptional regulator [Oligoflexus sp.]|uniref:LysR family transcriptional regulator n=1 Tax=Oligoflexus sp. TaxID=1971216 RepID=UPI002D389770|nr:LysR family transcriptional regulator [Oligoflexus sp.]HYX38035.1 LysR family transcriptional regulator [Oligoflexus sp.]
MRLHTIDLNLFVVFHAIHQEAHITRAAQVLGLTQPAVSHSLSRLRELYQDPLFVRRGPRMEPTPLARSLLPKVREALQQLHLSLPSTSTTFDPRETRQNFILATRDPLEGFFLPQLMQVFQKEAPLAQLTSLRIKRHDLEKQLATGQLDLAFDVLLPVASQLRMQKLMEDQWVVVARKDHPLLQGELPLAAYLEARHIVVSSRRTGPSIEDYELQRRGRERTIAMRCQHLFAAVRTAASTDLLLTLPSHFIRNSGLLHEVTCVPLPFECPLPAIYMYWHERHDEELASIWLRKKCQNLIEPYRQSN